MITATPVPSGAQTHFIFAANTGVNAVVGVPATAGPSSGGLMLSEGDELGAFDPGGRCVGAVVWTGSNAALTVWGDDEQTTVCDGMMDGDSISYRIWLRASDLEYEVVSLSYSCGNGLYSKNGILVLASMTAADVPLPVEMTWFRGMTSGNCAILTWWSAAEDRTSRFTIDRRHLRGDGHWIEMATVPVEATAMAPHEYRYVDHRLLPASYLYRLTKVDLDGVRRYGGSCEVTVMAPMQYALAQNYPNPFNPSTRIGYSIPQTSIVRVTIHDLLGRVIAVLHEGPEPAGEHEVLFVAVDVSGGVYVCRLEAVSSDDPSRRFIQTRRMLLVR